MLEQLLQLRTDTTAAYAHVLGQTHYLKGQLDLLDKLILSAPAPVAAAAAEPNSAPNKRKRRRR